MIITWKMNNILAAVYSYCTSPVADLTNTQQIIDYTLYTPCMHLVHVELMYWHRHMISHGKKRWGFQSINCCCRKLWLTNEERPLLCNTIRIFLLILIYFPCSTSAYFVGTGSVKSRAFSVLLQLVLFPNNCL